MGVGGFGGAAGEGGQAGDGMGGAGGEGGAGVGPIVVVNEVRTTGDGPDFVELYNMGDAVADLSDWSFEDQDTPDPNVYTFPAGTTLAPGAFLGVTETTFDFGLGSNDAVFLFDANGTAIDEYDWSVHQNTGGRCPDGSGPFELGLAPTLGAANDCD
jgi:hypothetical protein